MPKLTWCYQKPEVNRLEMLLKAYEKAAGLNSAKMAVRLGCSADNVRAQLRKPADQWRIGMLKRYCEVVGCPLEEAFAAVT